MHTMNEESEYCLRWHRHLNNFIESFGNLLENEFLADVFFFAEGQLVKAHKVVLSSCSNYFNTLFKETIERQPIIVLKDAKLDHIKMLLEFMYRGTVNIPQEAFEPIMKMAQTLNIKGLADGIFDIEKIDHEVEVDTPMSLIHPKIAHNHYTTPPPSSPAASKHIRPPIPGMYSAPSTSVQSALSNALTMPSALSLTSPLSLPHLASLPPNFASSLASTLSNAIPHSIASFIPPREMPQRGDGGGIDPPVHKRRRKQRRKSGDAPDSGDSDARSSGSPGDSVSNLQLPRIPATITPIGLHRQQMQHYPPNSQFHQLQPRDLSVHSSQNHSSHTNNYERTTQESPHRDRPHSIKPPPNIPGLLLPHHPPENHHKPQDEPENLENRRPSPSLPQDHSEQKPIQHEKPLKIEPNVNDEQQQQQNSTPIDSPPQQTEKDHESPLTSGRRSDEGSIAALRPSPKCASDPESLVSPAKPQLSHNRHDETSSDNNHFSEDERDEKSNGRRETVCERLSDSTPGPSTSRPQSEEAPPTPNFLGWPYSNDNNSSDEHFSSFASETNHGFWKNSFKGGLLAPYLGSPLGPLPHNPRGLTSTFPGLYGTPGGTPPSWGRRSSSPPGLGLPAHLRSNECSRCGRLYKTRKGLKHHIKNECGVEPRFQCTHCDWKFKQKAHLLRHMARKHTIS